MPAPTTPAPQVTGHTAILAVGATPPTFVPIVQLVGDVNRPPLTRESSEVTPHGDTVNTNLMSDVLMQGPATFTANFLSADASHDATAGLEFYAHSGDFVAWQLQGPGFVNNTTSDLKWTASLSNLEINAPEKAGSYNVSFTLTPTGVFQLDGTIVGVADGYS